MTSDFLCDDALNCQLLSLRLSIKSPQFALAFASPGCKVLSQIHKYIAKSKSEKLVTEMESSDTNASSPTNSSSNSPPVVVVSPCAACKILRRRCAEKCVLAPYFPPTEPAKFTTAHRVFGASNIIKFLQVLQFLLTKLVLLNLL